MNERNLSSIESNIPSGNDYKTSCSTSVATPSNSLNLTLPLSFRTIQPTYFIHTSIFNISNNNNNIFVSIIQQLLQQIIVEISSLYFFPNFYIRL